MIEDLMCSIKEYNKERDYQDIIDMINDSKSEFINLESKYGDDIYVAYLEEKLIGVAASNSGKLIVTPYIYVKSDFRRRGVGTQLLDYLEKRIISYKRTIHSQYNIKSENAEIVGFLKACGFEIWMSGNWMNRKGAKLDYKDINVRQYADDDFDICHKIESTTMFLMRESLNTKHNYYYPHNENDRKFYIEHSNNIFILEKNNKIIGIGDIDENELTGVSIDPMYQGLGYGTEFVKYLVNVIMDRGYKEVKLEAMIGNPARRLYDRLGFEDEYILHYMVKYYREDSRKQSLPTGFIKED